MNNIQNTICSRKVFPLFFPDSFRAIRQNSHRCAREPQTFSPCFPATAKSITAFNRRECDACLRSLQRPNRRQLFVAAENSQRLFPSQLRHAANRLRGPCPSPQRACHRTTFPSCSCFQRCNTLTFEIPNRRCSTPIQKQLNGFFFELIRVLTAR